MKNILIAFVFFQSVFSLSRQEASVCDWVHELKNSKSTESQLKLIHENFESCILILVEGIPLISDTSSFYFGDLKFFVQRIQKKEIDSINIIQDDAARTLYGTAVRNGVIVIT